MRFEDIETFPTAHYSVNVAWGYLEKHLRSFEDDIPLNMNPDYQRDHVWTEEQQIAYVEYRLKGGEAGREILTNCPGWVGSETLGPYELLDGKQRITAVLRFLHDEIRVFGHLYSEFEGRMRMTGTDFIWKVFTLSKREDILNVYLGINAGGTPHKKEEIDRVRRLLEEERNKKR